MNSERRTPSLGMAMAFPLLVAWMAGCASAPVTPSATAMADAAADADVPFRMTLTPFEISGLPALHSVAHAVYREPNPADPASSTSWLVIVSGRKNGRHELVTQASANPNEWSFPPLRANNQVFLVDLNKRQLVASSRIDCPTGTTASDCLPSTISRQLMATNTQSFTRIQANTGEEWFYIVGGYGVTADGNSMLTFDQAVAINLPGLIRLMRTAGNREGNFLGIRFAQHCGRVTGAPCIRAGNDPALAVTGGGIEQLGDRQVLVFGQLFNGLYTNDVGAAQQEYSQAVRLVSILLGGKRIDGIDGLSVSYLGQCPDPAPIEPQPTPDGPYHRRDFTLARVLTPEGTPRIGVFGGVFKGGRSEGYLHPVYITQDGKCVIPDRVDPKDLTKATTLPFALNEDTGSKQLLSQYESAIIPAYSAKRKAMYTTFFGGISQYYWDPQSRTLKRDEVDPTLKTAAEQGLPFTSSISTLRVGGTGGNGHFLHIDEKGDALTFPPGGGEPACGGLRAPYLGANAWFVMADGVETKDGVILLDRIQTKTVIGYIFGGIAAMRAHPGKQTCASNKVYEVTLDPQPLTPSTVKLVEPPKPLQ
jgi:hypothetical protein